MLGNLTIRTKTYLGFGLMLALLVAVAVFGYLAVNEADHGFNTYRGLARDTNLAGRLQANMLMLRMSVKNFIISSSDKDKAQYTEYLGKMNQFLEESRREIVNPQRAKRIAEMDQALKTYEKAFEEVVKLQAKRNRLVKQVLDVQGPKAERTLTSVLTDATRSHDMKTALGVSLALRNLLLGRLHMVKFLDVNSQATVDRAKAEFARCQGGLTPIIAALGEGTAKKQLQETKQNVDKYQQAFNELASAIFERNKLVTGTLDAIGPKVAVAVEEVKLSIKAEQDNLGPSLKKAMDRSVVMIIGVSAVAALLAILIGLAIARAIVTPLAKVVDLIKNIAEGEGDLTARLAAEGKDEIAQLATEFNKFVSKIHDIIVQVKQAASELAVSASEISQGNQDLSTRTQEQAAAIEETASSLEEMTGSVKQSASNSSQADRLAKKTAEMAENGGQVVERTVSSMNEVSVSSNKISDIINVVNEIAFQTNLLALNAAVEAARAGEAGRGFAVVAGEVRNLAGRSASAAKEIQALISESVSKVEAGNEMVAESGRILKDIIEYVQKVADTIAEISSSSEEQATGIDEVNRAVIQMDGSVQQNAALVEEAASASENMAANAQNLLEIVSRFRLDETGQVAMRRSLAAKPKALPAKSFTAAKPAAKTAAQPAAKPAAKKEAKKDDFFEGDLDGFEQF